eukprot:6913313-Pyramimonas_sp.AAC.1
MGSVVALRWVTICTWAEQPCLCACPRPRAGISAQGHAECPSFGAGRACPIAPGPRAMSLESPIGRAAALRPGSSSGGPSAS